MVNNMDEVTIYTDGACSGNPGPGGWGAILMLGENRKEISGGSENTTNNIMELTAVIEALKILKRPCKVNIYSDSAYVVNAFLQKWIYGWMKKGWKTAGGDSVKNKELWKELYSLTKTHDVTFNKVKGHADNEFNNRCDEMAVAESKKFTRVYVNFFKFNGHFLKFLLLSLHFLYYFIFVFINTICWNYASY